AAVYAGLPMFGSSCKPAKRPIPISIKNVQPTLEDDLVLAEGLNYDILIKWKDAISETDQFGFNNDFVAYCPFDKSNPDDGILFVNHESPKPLFVSEYDGKSDKTKEQVEKEMYSVGASVIRVKKENGKWAIVNNDPINKRISAKTMIDIAWPEPIMGSTKMMGTLGNCSGGVTPWGNFLTCEENYDNYYGETTYEDGERKLHESHYGWEKYVDNPPEHYGWVVEVNPHTGDCKKLIGLGRMAHECSTVFEAADKRLVVYTGDDSMDECLYKFISDEPGSLDKGKLYVANLEDGKWESMQIEEQKILQDNFKSQTEVLIRTREAARLVGGTLLDRPEDIDIDPLTGDVYMTLTNNIPKGNMHGSIIKILEDNRDKTSLTFKHETFLAGGKENGFSCPDNMAFDANGNFWFTSDISGSVINKGPYIPFGNNGLYLVPVSGPDKGQIIQVASAPKDAEFTGPWFSPDGSTMFLSVQHPGERSKSLDDLTSNWPNKKGEIPQPSVITLQGPLLDAVSKIS
ncbi:MAG: DUF839 domain-containing protein, partial [Bacteroidia bacterium]|nr:DUF839 domain-containing protein [Bacteroidia bacterium]NNM15660.1 DUF839 domain-containing protein [Bacteroidia bacterium]